MLGGRITLAQHNKLTPMRMSISALETSWKIHHKGEYTKHFKNWSVDRVTILTFAWFVADERPSLDEVWVVALKLYHCFIRPLLKISILVKTNLGFLQINNKENSFYTVPIDIAKVLRQQFLPKSKYSPNWGEIIIITFFCQCFSFLVSLYVYREGGGGAGEFV